MSHTLGKAYLCFRTRAQFDAWPKLERPPLWVTKGMLLIGGALGKSAKVFFSIVYFWANISPAERVNIKGTWSRKWTLTENSCTCLHKEKKPY